jgi:type I restriction enzyme S subunit
MVGIYSFGKGLFDKEILSGINTSYKKFYCLKSNHIVMSQLFGWEGAIALCSPEYEGKYVSSQFPTFLVRTDKMDTKFLGYYLQQPKVWKDLFEKGKGMGSRRRTLTPENLLSLNISYPPLKEQGIIVGILDKVNAKIEIIRKLKLEQERNIKNLLSIKFDEYINDAKWLPMSEAAPITRRKVELESDEIYNEIGVRSFGKGLFLKPSFKGKDLSWQQPYWMKEGDLLFSNIKAWEGAVAVIPGEYNGWVGSHRYITCKPDYSLIKPEFLLFYFLTSDGIAKLSYASPGSADRNRTLNTKILSKSLVPIPSVDKQISFLNLKKKCDLILNQYKRLN